MSAHALRSYVIALAIVAGVACVVAAAVGFVAARLYGDDQPWAVSA